MKHIYNPTNVFKYLHCIDVGYYDSENVQTLSAEKDEKKNNPFYTLFVVVSGEGNISYNDVSLTVKSKDIFILSPCEKFLNEPKGKKHYKYYWMTFEGKEFDNYFHYKKSLVNSIIRSASSDKIVFMFSRLFVKYSQETINEELLLAILFEMLVLLDAKKVYGDDNDYVNKIVFIINNNFDNPTFNIKSISDSLHLSHSWLCAFFKKSTGCTMQQYLIDLRLDKAEEMLINTNMSVGDVAAICGFKDALYFSTSFKKRFNFSPINYRLLKKQKKLLEIK